MRLVARNNPSFRVKLIKKEPECHLLAALVKLTLAGASACFMGLPVERRIGAAAPLAVCHDVELELRAAVGG
jgi:hypothetical protein